MEQKEHTGEQTLTDNQKEVIEEQTMPIEATMEHPDERIAPAECQNILTEKATDEEQMATSVEKETPSEEQRVSIEEQHATTEEQKTPRVGEEALMEGQREVAREKRVVGVGVAVSSHEQDVKQATAGTDDVDSKETDAKQGPEGQQEEKVNQANQEMEVTTPTPNLTRGQLMLTTVYSEQEQNGVQTDGVPSRVEVEDFKEPV